MVVAPASSHRRFRLPRAAAGTCALVLVTALLSTCAAHAVELQLGTTPRADGTSIDAGQTTKSSLVVRERASAGRLRATAVALNRYTRQRRSADELAASAALEAGPGIAVDLQTSLAAGADFIAERGAGATLAIALPWGLGLRTALAYSQYTVDSASTTSRTSLSGGFGRWRLGLESAQELDDDVHGDPRSTTALTADLRYRDPDWSGVLRALHGRLPGRSVDGHADLGATDDTGVEMTLESPYGLAGTVAATRPVQGLTRTTLRLQLARRF